MTVNDRTLHPGPAWERAAHNLAPDTVQWVKHPEVIEVNSLATSRKETTCKEILKP